MGSHPINLAVRFLLEVAALLAIGIWGWWQGDFWWRYILAIGVPLFTAIIWGFFNVPNDPSRSGSAPVAIPGWLRLIIELSIFTFATWTLYDLNYVQISLVLGIVVVIHYLLSYDRILWLFGQNKYAKNNVDNTN